MCSKWSRRAVLTVGNYSFQCSKNIFSKTSKWEEKLTTEMKKEIEDHWRPILKRHSEKKGQVEKEKMYVLSMFPYPSGKLHMGHIRIYATGDTLANYFRIKGKNVIHPIGWDAFGLPAENAAHQHGALPKTWTYNNISHMKTQLELFGFSFDWNREIATCHPGYYKWTQFIFLKMFEHGFAYQNKALVNWDPVDKTVLSNEQIDELGCSWRSGAKAEKKLLKQWFLKISKLAKSLSDALNDDKLKNWKGIRDIQQDWIGNCNGWKFNFNLQCNNGTLDEHLQVWTPNPEFIFGTSFIAISPEHHLNKQWNKSGEDDCVLHNIFAIHPFTKEKIPLVVSTAIDMKFAPFDISHLGLPYADPVHYAIAKKFNLPIIEVAHQVQNGQQVLKDSLEFSGMDMKTAREEICAYARRYKFGGYQTSNKLGDWLLSRQRYWGAPIPIIYCKNCKTVPVPYDQLPVVLPDISKLLKSREEFASPLSEVHEWVNVECPKCGRAAKRETDTMDTFIDSSWYFLRYLDPRNDTALFSSVAQFLPVDIYVGGEEHGKLHLLYARFVYHFLQETGILLSSAVEPFQRLLMIGKIMNQSYRIKNSGRYLTKDDVIVSKNGTVEKSSGEPVIVEWEKMSKSKFNGIDPEEIVSQHGVDTTRLFTLADCAPTSARPWNLKTIPGILRWQNRLWTLMHEFVHVKPNDAYLIKQDNTKHRKFLFEERNFSIKNVTYCIEHEFRLNNGIKYLQRLVKSLGKVPREMVGKCKEYENTLAALLVMLAPFAPHFSCELWKGFLSSSVVQQSWKEQVWEQEWPQVDKEYLMDLVIKVNEEDIGLPVKISQNKLVQLSREEAIRMSEDIVMKRLKNKKVKGIVFTNKPGYRAEIDYIVSKAKKEKTVTNNCVENVQ